MRAALLTLALASALAVGACSAGAESGVGAPASAPTSTATPTSPPTPVEVPTETATGALTRAALAEALLTVDDLPAGFRLGNPEAGSAADVGCLALTTDLDGLGAESSTRLRFVTENEAGAAGVLTKAISDGDLRVLRRGLNRFATALRTCKSVAVTDEDGATTRLDVVSDRRRSSRSAERQVNFRATGTVAGVGLVYPYRIAYSVSLVRRTLAIVAAFEVGRTPAGVVDDLAALDAQMIERVASLDP